MSENTALWDTLGKTDPSQTKGFKRAGGFSGTAVKPMWVWRRLTEQLGPCGTGWGMEKPAYQMVPGENREVLVFCTVEAWYIENGERKVVFGTGGDKVVTYIKANEQYNRPERWENDDEAFKKAFTDALMNAFKFVGVAADVHMGMFDDNKYVQALREEFAANERGEQPPPHGDEPAPRSKLEGKHSSKSALQAAIKGIVGKVGAAQTTRELDAIELEYAEDLKQCERHLPRWWLGDPEKDFAGVKATLATRRAFLGLVDTMLACETKAQMTAFMQQAGDTIDGLSDAERREFESAWAAHESSIEQMDRVAA